LTPAAAEPFMPAEGTAVLENLAFDLAREASELSAQLHPVVRLSVADLVRSMNCYYSNLIEGHNTHPRDIDRALAADYSSDPHRRDLQLEARAHIEVQQMIDERVGDAATARIACIHRVDASGILQAVAREPAGCREPRHEGAHSGRSRGRCVPARSPWVGMSRLRPRISRLSCAGSRKRTMRPA
jgi:hypothetical protein